MYMVMVELLTSSDIEEAVAQGHGQFAWPVSSMLEGREESAKKGD